jgi:hypothetical protein
VDIEKWEKQPTKEWNEVNSIPCDSEDEEFEEDKEVISLDKIWYFFC